MLRRFTVGTHHVIYLFVIFYHGFRRQALVLIAPVLGHCLSVLSFTEHRQMGTDEALAQLHMRNIM